MKSVMITFDQAFYERIIQTLDRLNCRGFSYFQQVQGRGSKTGEPHYGSHAWPSMCSAIITIVDDARVDPLLKALHAMDKETEMLGLRAFVWNIEQSIKKKEDSIMNPLFCLLFSSICSPHHFVS